MRMSWASLNGQARRKPIAEMVWSVGARANATAERCAHEKATRSLRRRPCKRPTIKHHEVGGDGERGPNGACEEVNSALLQGDETNSAGPLHDITEDLNLQAVESNLTTSTANSRLSAVLVVALAGERSEARSGGWNGKRKGVRAQPLSTSRGREMLERHDDRRGEHCGASQTTARVPGQ